MLVTDENDFKNNVKATAKMTAHMALLNKVMSLPCQM